MTAEHWDQPIAEPTKQTDVDQKKNLKHNNNRKPSNNKAKKHNSTEYFSIEKAQQLIPLLDKCESTECAICLSLSNCMTYTGCPDSGTWCWVCELKFRRQDLLSKAKHTCRFCQCELETVVLARKPSDSNCEVNKWYNKHFKLFCADSIVYDAINQLTKYYCWICRTPIESASEWLEHISTSHDLIGCKTCLNYRKRIDLDAMLQAYNSAEFNKHFALDSNKDFSHKKCPICNRVCYNNFEFYNHWKSSDNHLDCQFCATDDIEPFLFKDYDRLKQHYFNKHKICSYCDQPLKDEHSLVAHISLNHNMVVDFNSLIDLSIKEKTKLDTKLESCNWSALSNDRLSLYPLIILREINVISVVLREIDKLKNDKALTVNDNFRTTKAFLNSIGLLPIKVDETIEILTFCYNKLFSSNMLFKMLSVITSLIVTTPHMRRMPVTLPETTNSKCIIRYESKCLIGLLIVMNIDLRLAAIEFEEVSSLVTDDLITLHNVCINHQLVDFISIKRSRSLPLFWNSSFEECFLSYLIINMPPDQLNSESTIQLIDNNLVNKITKLRSADNILLLTFFNVDLPSDFNSKLAEAVQKLRLLYATEMSAVRKELAELTKVSPSQNNSQRRGRRVPRNAIHDNVLSVNASNSNLSNDANQYITEIKSHIQKLQSAVNEFMQNYPIFELKVLLSYMTLAFSPEVMRRQNNTDAPIAVDNHSMFPSLDGTRGVRSAAIDYRVINKSGVGLMAARQDDCPTLDSFAPTECNNSAGVPTISTLLSNAAKYGRKNGMKSMQIKKDFNDAPPLESLGSANSDSGNSKKTTITQKEYKLNGLFSKNNTTRPSVTKSVEAPPLSVNIAATQLSAKERWELQQKQILAKKLESLGPNNRLNRKL